MTPNPREVATLANEIMQLEDKLLSLKEQWERMFNVPSEQPKTIGRPPRENSVASQVLGVINANESTRWDADGLAHHLNIEKESVASALYNLYIAKKIARPSRGSYQSLMGNPYTEQIDVQLEHEQKESHAA